jgi:hypothetical protein
MRKTAKWAGALVCDPKIGGRYWSREAPIWPLEAGVLAVTLVAWRSDRRGRRLARIGHCPNCNYDRRGIAADVPCPECGAAAIGADTLKI